VTVRPLGSAIVRSNPKSPIPNPDRERPQSIREGWQGWDEYAPFYDWENARTLGRRDVPFWRRLASAADGRVLELGSGTGRVSLPLARAGVRLVGVDRSAAMLDVASRRSANRLRQGYGGPPKLHAKAEPSRDIPVGGSSVARRFSRAIDFVRADVRALPFADHSFAMALAPYGLLQSLLTDRDLTLTLGSVARVLRRGGIFGIDLVPDVPRWREYRNRVQLRGPARDGARLTLIESVRQDRRRRLTTFEQRYVRRCGKRVDERRFELTFRTVSVRQLTGRLEAAGFVIDAVLGDYRGRPWDERADVWIVLARRA
jgi:ubiquinone/menaquinone biosynthesis C-methylase UbiE